MYLLSTYVSQCNLVTKKMNQWFAGTPEKFDLEYRGRERGRGRPYVQGWKGDGPLSTPFSGEGDGERLWLDSGGVASMKWQGVKGVAPELPPAKGAGRGTAVSMVLSSLIQTIRFRIFRKGTLLYLVWYKIGLHNYKLGLQP
jgi:hypothetical protein